MGLKYAEDSAVMTGAAPGQGLPAAGPSRRAVLAAAAAALPLLLTACKGVQALGTPPPPAPDIVALRGAISAEELMVARYAVALRPFEITLPLRVTPRDMTVINALKAVRAEHTAHLAQLRSRLVEPAGSTPTTSPSASPSPTASPAGGLAADLTALTIAEQSASNRLIGQLAGLPPTLAQLFASIAASEATHVPYLQAAERGR